MKLRIIIAICVVSITLFQHLARAEGDPTFGYRLELDVVYGQGRISPQGTEMMRYLKMDVYTPTAAGDGPWPAVVYVHGGAWHRGGRRNPPYKLGGAVHSTPEDYARLLAPLGYVVFIVEYRLAPQNPVPSFSPGERNTLTDIMSVIKPAQVLGLNRGRTGAGLPPLEYTQKDIMVVWNAYISGVEDVTRAVEFVVANAEKFNIDPDRIAMGGHSAGAAITTSVGLAMGARLKAIFPMSSPDILFDKDVIAKKSDLPAVLFHFAQYDDEPVLENAPALVAMLKKAGADYQFAWVPSFPHFYPNGASSLADDGTRMAIRDRIILFLDNNLKK